MMARDKKITGSKYIQKVKKWMSFIDTTLLSSPSPSHIFLNTELIAAGVCGVGSA